jgi:hypothetical protein
VIVAVAKKKIPIDSSSEECLDYGRKGGTVQTINGDEKQAEISIPPSSTNLDNSKNITGKIPIYQLLN